MGLSQEILTHCNWFGTQRTHRTLQEVPLHHFKLPETRNAARKFGESIIPLDSNKLTVLSHVTRGGQGRSTSKATGASDRRKEREQPEMQHGKWEDSTPSTNGGWRAGAAGSGTGSGQWAAGSRVAGGGVGRQVGAAGVGKRAASGGAGQRARAAGSGRERRAGAAGSEQERRGSGPGAPGQRVAAAGGMQRGSERERRGSEREQGQSGAGTQTPRVGGAGQGRGRRGSGRGGAGAAGGAGRGQRSSGHECRGSGRGAKRDPSRLRQRMRGRKRSRRAGAAVSGQQAIGERREPGNRAESYEAGPRGSGGASTPGEQQAEPIQNANFGGRPTAGPSGGWYSHPTDVSGKRRRRMECCHIRQELAARD
ncbi:hypothetical protein B0H11DRAFT_1908711 [Mycena galericulata]|nr:hypothetical protein B0H11DRAFT_1908711 [Mycena galericulata]